MVQNLLLLSYYFFVFGLLRGQDCAKLFACSTNQTLPQRGEKCVTKSSDQTTDIIAQCANENLLCDTILSHKCIAYEEDWNLGFAGSPCTKNETCTYGKCKDGFCTGAHLNEKCFYTAMCDPGLYCTHQKCTLVKELNEKCHYHEECRIDLACNNGACIEMFSQPAGTVLLGDQEELDSQYRSIACESGWFYLNQVGQRQCSNSSPVLLNKEEPYKCEDVADYCKYEYPENQWSFTLNSKCYQDQNSEGIYYCSVVPSNERNITADIKALVKGPNHCSTMFKGKWAMCGEVVRDPIKWRSLIINHFEAYFWSFTVDIPSCMKYTVKNSLYFWAVEGRQQEYTAINAEAQAPIAV